jgi:hypothetical protein
MNAATKYFVIMPRLNKGRTADKVKSVVTVVFHSIRMA